MSTVRSLWLVWQDPKNRLYYHVGTLSYFNGHYEFNYTHATDELMKLSEAQSNGYMLHPAFPDPNKVYVSNCLFAAFDRRLPSPDRKDFPAIVRDLGLAENCSKMDLLEATRGRLANDTYSFERPLRVEDDGKLHTTFFIHGMRHRQLPESWPTWLQVGSAVKLRCEGDNKIDPYAVGIYTLNDTHIGYAPRFYSKSLSALLKDGIKPHAIVTYLNEKSSPHWWVMIKYESELFDLEKSICENLKSAAELSQHV